MAYSKRSRKHKQFKKNVKKFTKPKKPEQSTVGWLASKAWQGVRLLKDVINTEYKHLDTFQTQPINWSGYFPVINVIPQGVTDNQRVGDSCKIQNFVLRGNVFRGASDAVVRFMLVWDDQSKVSTVADILAATGSVYAPIAPKNYDKRFQTKILKEFRVHLTADTPIKKINMNMPINLHTQFSAGTTTIDTGKLFLVVISDRDPAVPANLPNFVFYSRLSYTDN